MLFVRESSSSHSRSLAHNGRPWPNTGYSYHSASADRFPLHQWLTRFAVRPAESSAIVPGIRARRRLKTKSPLKTRSFDAGNKPTSV